MPARLRPSKTGPRSKYPTWMLRVGQSFARTIETKTGSYDWRSHNRIRSSVYQYMKLGGKGRKFTVKQELKADGLFVVVTRVE